MSNALEHFGKKLLAWVEALAAPLPKREGVTPPGGVGESSRHERQNHAKVKAKCKRETMPLTGAKMLSWLSLSVHRVVKHVPMTILLTSEILDVVRSILLSSKMT